MASKENQEILNQIKEYRVEWGQIYNRDKRFTEIVDLIQEVIDKLEEKQIPKEPQLEGDGYADGYMVYDTAICPNCGEIICKDGKEDINWGNDYCHKCGQRISWEFER